MRMNDRKSMLPGVLHHFLVIFFRRAEFLRKVLRSQPVVVIGAGRVMQILQQSVQLGLIPQRQPQIEPQMVRSGQRVHRRQLTGGRHNMAGNDPAILSVAIPRQGHRQQKTE